MAHKTNTESKHGPESLKQRTQLQFMRLVAAIGVTAALAACGGAKPTESAPIKPVSTEVATTIPSTSIAIPEAVNHIQVTTTTEKPKNPAETLPNVEFEPGKVLGSIKIIAPGTRFETDPDVTKYYPLQLKFETPGIENDPVLKGAAGVTRNNPITGKLLAQPGAIGTATAFEHRTHPGFKPGNAFDQLKPNAGHQIALHRISKYNDDGTEAEGVDMLFDIIDTGVVPFDDEIQANRVFGEPGDPTASDLVLYTCSGPKGEPGPSSHRIYVRGRMVPPTTPTVPLAMPVQG